MYNLQIRSKVSWALFFASVVPLTLILLRASLFGFTFAGVLLGCFILLLWVFNAVWAVLLAIRSTQHDCLRRALISWLIPILFILSIFVAPKPIWLINRLGDEIHFFVMRNAYLTEIARIPQSLKPKLVVFDLGGMFGTSQAIVYDESDELSLSANKRSEAWQQRTEKTQLSCEPIFAETFLRFTGLTKHFYMVTYSC